MKTPQHLLIPDNVFRDIQRIVSEAHDVYEAGITLFGVPMDTKHPPSTCWVVLAVAKTGLEDAKKPTHDGLDAEYLNFAYRLLRDSLPSLRWLGALHVHPRGMHWLTLGDRRWVQGLLKSASDDILRPEEFIAGVLMWRKEAVDLVDGVDQRRENALDFFPSYFSREHAEGVPVNGISYIGSDAPLVKEARDLAEQPCAPCSGAIALPRTHGKVIELYYWEYLYESHKLPLRIRRKHDD